MVESNCRLILACRALLRRFRIHFCDPVRTILSAGIDSAAKSGSWGFRLAILSGAVALQPLMAVCSRNMPVPSRSRNQYGR
jgi:hypothetical protein